MQSSTLNVFITPMALLGGTAIGYGFGLLQAAATRRHAKLQAQGKFNTGWAATPGSMRRVAFLLVALAVTQFLFPIFFTPGGLSQWAMALGVVGGYGIVLYRGLRERMALARS